MYQSIPENLAQILLKRMFVFIMIVMVVSGVITLRQTDFTTSYKSLNRQENPQEMIKSGMIFTTIDLR